MEETACLEKLQLRLWGGALSPQAYGLGGWGLRCGGLGFCVGGKIYYMNC